MNKVIILRGLPGSTKTTLSKKIIDEIQIPTTYCVCSTDNFWTFRQIKIGYQGECFDVKKIDDIYLFNQKSLGKAHQANLLKFQVALNCGVNLIIVDNTNTTWKEIEKYAVLAIGSNYEIEVMEPDTWWKFDIEECFKRNTHGVPKETIQKMLNRWETTESINLKIEELKRKNEY